MKSRIPSPALAREQGVALIIVLAFIVLLAGLVVAYFNQPGALE
jgi:Tfp pilus assembly protein PilX